MWKFTISKEKIVHFDTLKKNFIVLYKIKE